MIVSYTWLQEYFKDTLPEPKELSGILNTRAFEVEGIEQVGTDVAIDIDVLPNRAHDCLSHYGIAKEISVLTGLEFAPPAITETAVTSEKTINVSIAEKVPCQRYVGRVIENVHITESPQEVKDRLATLGQRSINNVVDSTNIVMYDLGQPMHAFDADKVSGTITVRMANDGEVMTTLDGTEVKLDSTMMVIADEEGVLALAGVKGGKKAEVDTQTKNIILEAANFNAATVRKVSTTVGISTDSSKRFERAITPELALQGMEHVTSRIMRHAATDDTHVGAITDVYPKAAGTYKTGVSLERLQNYLGIAITQKDVDATLHKLGFSFEYVDAKSNFVELAKSLEGAKHVYGASVLRDAPESFDCSSFTAYCAKESGLSIPRMAIDQYVYADEITKDELEPGDLVFSNRHLVSDENQSKFNDDPKLSAMVRSEHDTSQEFMPGTKIPAPIDHLGIYIGDGKIIHCSGANDGVAIEDLETSQPFHDIASYRRIFTAGEKRYVVTVPDVRLDIRIEQDLIEEIARIYGYENIGGTPISTPVEAATNDVYQYLTSARAILAARGFSEVMTSSFAEQGDVKTVKAFASDKAYLRTNLQEGMQRALALNDKNKDLLGLQRVKLFEIGHVFVGDTEQLHIALGVSGKKTESIIQDALQGIGLSGKDTQGVVEVVVPTEKLPEINGTELPETTIDRYVPFSQYPFVLRDIAVWVPDSVTEAELLQIITEQAGELLVQSTLFDRYEKDGRVSYAYRLVFQSHERTLTDEEITPIMDVMTSVLNGKGFEVR